MDNFNNGGYNQYPQGNGEPNNNYNGASNNYSYSEMPNNNAFNGGMQMNVPTENVVAGTVGAFLFALAGGLLYFVIYQFGFIAGICGIVTFVLATMGYQKFGKRISVKGVVISIVIAVIIIFLAEYLSLAYVIFDSFKGYYDITFFDAVRAVPEFMTEPEVIGSFVKDLLISYALGAISSFATVKQMLSENKRVK